MVLMVLLQDGDVTCLPQCIAARVRFGVPQSGQRGYHHRTELNKKIYLIGDAVRKARGGPINYNATTAADLTKKVITPLGGFPKYGKVNEDFLMIKGTVCGTKKRVITIRKSLYVHTKRSALEEITLKFIDTSSKWGHGRWFVSLWDRKSRKRRAPNYIRIKKRVSTVFNPSEMVDTIAVTKGHGVDGVVTRWGCYLFTSMYCCSCTVRCTSIWSTWLPSQNRIE
jgi:ribosomal protein L3